MPVLGTLPNDKMKLVALFINENAKYQTNLGRLSTFERIAQNPKESEERRAEALAKYTKLKKDVEDGSENLKKLQKNVDKYEGGKALTKIQKDIKELLEEKNLLIDPNDPQAKRIDGKIEDLVKPFQNAYSKVVGARISENVARTKLLGRKVPGFGEPTNVQSTSQQPNVDEEVKGAYVAYDSSGNEITLETDPKNPNVYLKPGTDTPYTGVLYNKDKTKKFDVKDGKYTEPSTGKNKIDSENKGNLNIKDSIPLDTQTFESTFTTGGVPAGYVPSEEAAVNKAAGVESIAEKYGLSEALFKNIPSLNLIFQDYVNPKKKMTDDEFVRRIRNDVWYKKNSAGIKNRFVQYYQYRDLQESGQAQGTTQYEQDIEGIVRNLERRATEIGSAAASDPTALRSAAENLYLTNKEKDTTFIDDFLASSIRSVAGTIGGKTTQGYSGAALQNYNALVKAARENGFQVADIIPGGANVDQVLSGIASGKIDVNRVVADARKLAAQGQPQYVRDLLAQGYNLDQVFKPYRTAMANVLEIGDPDQIDLNDPLLRSAITDKGDMNLYDFKKALRQDNRWQYTEQAKKDVSTAAFDVLRDFGFQG
jgi:hypothetical protein